MTSEPQDRILPGPGEDLPLAIPVQEARIALKRAVELLREFQNDTRYPVITRAETESVISAILEADRLTTKLDPPFVMKR